MKIKIEVEVELRHTSGKFASTDDLAQKIIDDIEEPGEVESDDGAVYEVVSFQVVQA